MQHGEEKIIPRSNSFSKTVSQIFSSFPVIPPPHTVVFTTSTPFRGVLSLSSSGMRGKKRRNGTDDNSGTWVGEKGCFKVRRLELLSSAVLIIRSVWNPYGPRISRLVENNNK
ncbi:hypothetical protein TNCT_374921 [Trichonephila clavata]|uniref:Uncharacterized protein n=1 Tax=Trichonephila clavata TaxID=2740835 RepID=A0A8X6FSB2_TRICU|nr:hypothetical protein TNCT_374921 [Trichonephila clavata]